MLKLSQDTFTGREWARGMQQRKLGSINLETIAKRSRFNKGDATSLSASPIGLLVSRCGKAVTEVWRVESFGV